MKTLLSRLIFSASCNMLFEVANAASATTSGYVSSPFPVGTKYTHWHYECLDLKLCKIGASEAAGGAEALTADVFVGDIAIGSGAKTVVVVRAKSDDPKKMFESIASFSSGGGMPAFHSVGYLLRSVTTDADDVP
jgi:hypothetical protein